MTRYLSQVSGYYGCRWKQEVMPRNQASEYHQMTDLLQQRDTDCRKMRLHSLFEDLPVKEIKQIEGYSPSAVRKHRAKTVPPLQDIYEDMIFYPSNWVSPSLTKKQRRDILNKRNKKFPSLNDENNNNNNNVTALRITETFHSPQTKRRNFGKHFLTPLPENKITRSFDETITEDEEEEEDHMDSSGENVSVVRRRGSNGERSRYRPRSWSE